MIRKHAFLIMSHHRMDILVELLKSLDDKRCDIYIHIDKKCQEQLCIQLNYSKIYFVKPMDVRWGDYSQIKCELMLLREANKRQSYEYYHLITGASFPIKNNNYIYEFFEQNKGYEFIGFDNAQNYSERIAYYYWFTKIGKPNKRLDYLKIRIRNMVIGIQKKISFSRIKDTNLVIKKGLAYWSITDECANYILNNDKLIKKLFKYSFCGDEVFVQTLVYNSNFKKHIFSYDNEFKGCLCFTTWDESIGEREGHCFLSGDYKNIAASECLFALKFDGSDGIELINKIKSELLDNGNQTYC